MVQTSATSAIGVEGNEARFFWHWRATSLISPKIFSSNAHTLATAAVTERVDELLFRCDSNLAGEAYSERRKTSSNIINSAEVLNSVGQRS